MIQLLGITKSFGMGEEQVRALGPLDLAIPDGQTLAIVGPSGAGKSTLLSLMGLLERPTAGGYSIDGDACEAMTESQRTVIRRERIGFVFQRYNLVEELNVLQNVGLPLIYRGWSAAARRRAAEEMLERVGLGAKASRRPSQLSGGQQQRVAIARALVGAPAILLCDEPTGNLDTQTGTQTLDLLLHLHCASPGRILVVVTHNLDIARRLDRVVLLQDGRVLRDGVPEKVLAS